MAELTKVCRFLRHRKREDLAELLANARATYNLLDVGSTGEEIIPFGEVTLWFPASAEISVQGLTSDDERVIREALVEAGGYGYGLESVYYMIDWDSLGDGPLVLLDSSTGWENVDLTMAEIRKQLNAAATPVAFQNVGITCREALISLAQEVSDPQRHPALDGYGSRAWFKCSLGRYIAAEMNGAANKEIRQCVNSATEFATSATEFATSAFGLANKVQHDRNASYRNAALCVQATFSVVGMIQIMAGQRSRGSED